MDLISRICFSCILDVFAVLSMDTSVVLLQHGCIRHFQHVGVIAVRHGSTEFSLALHRECVILSPLPTFT